VASATGASRMAQTASDGVVEDARIGHRVANDRVSRNSAYPMPLEAVRRAFEDASIGQRGSSRPGGKRCFGVALDAPVSRIIGRALPDSRPPETVDLAAL